MSLATGTRLGAYEVLALIGAGGMGEVYRARDTRLGRDVAIKVVSDGFGHEPERVARFEREAHLLATLNHPHIAAIYGFEESSGSQFLVMELVEGETLADRITGTTSGSGLQASGQKGLPVAEALAVARQVAAALQAAHEKGIIHRDLKPANVALTADGQVKVLDFGLAKALDPVQSTGLSNSPTLTLGATQAGVVLGTAAYMSPEQVKGRAADQRSDVWAFGCVLFEMLTGTRAFAGEDVSDTLASVLRGEPEWTALPPNVPAAVQTLIRGCLAKDRQQRIGDMSAALFVLNEPTILAPTASANPPAVAVAPQPARWRRVATHAGAALAAAIVAGAAVWLAMLATLPQPRISRLLITPPSAAALAVTGATTRDVAITPDGTKVIYVGANGTALFVRPLDQLDATRLTGLGAPTGPFVSPDGQWVGFTDGGVLKKVAITGGPAEMLTQSAGGSRGATWAPDGTIVFATNNSLTGLQQLAAGGEVTVLTRPDGARGENDHLWPEFLPGGQAVLFTITATTGGLDQAQVAVLDLQSGMRTTLIRGGTDAHYVPSGHLVYGAGGTLRAVAFDLARLAVVGTAVPVVEQVVTTNGGGVAAAVADDGTLVYLPGVGVRSDLERTLAWVDRKGQETPILAEPHTYEHPRISPDGNRVALHALDEGNDLWLWDLMRSTLKRLTFEPGGDIYPVWTADSRRLFFSSARAGVPGLFALDADGTGAVTRLLEGEPRTLGESTSLSSDMRLVFHQRGTTTSFDIMQLRLDKANEVTPLVRTPAAERNGDISPDGRWLAFEANDTGQYEIYVASFPDAGGRDLVSTGGGRQPLWAKRGSELFYLAPTGLMRVDVGRGTTWAPAGPAKLFDVGRYYTGSPTAAYGRMYDVALDGQRFLMIKPGGGSESGPAPTAPTSLVVVQHFDEELKRLLPIKN